MINLLFVHPDQKLSQLYRARLKDHFRVHAALDGLSAVRMAKIVLPQAVVSDYFLPLLSAKGLVSFLRNFEPTKAVPVIILSRHQFEDEVLNLGASEWLPQHKAHPDLVAERIYYHLKLIKRFEATN